MDKKKAIELLKEQITKLDNSTVDDVWVSQTASLVKEFLGETSEEYQWIKNFNVKVIVWNIDEKRKKFRENNSKAVRFIQSCIEAIELKALYKKPKNNFLQRWDNATLTTVITFALTTVFLGGMFLGKLQADVQNIELRQDLKALQEKCK